VFAYAVRGMPESVQPHILVVDDDPQIRDMLQEYFAANALRSSATSSGREMMRILADQAVDLVVLDLHLAGEDGMALARRMREKSAIPIIMLTGVLDEADRVMALELGADDYITKPFSPRQLLARVRTLLTKRR
jgi:two-component system OmpR family response regulator